MRVFIYLVLTEADFAEVVFAALEPHFDLSLEHWGTHPTGKRLRIDAIARPRNPEHWSRPDIALGIEIKMPCTDRAEGMRDRKTNAKIVSQCIDYSLVDWDGFGMIPIFFSPGFPEIGSLRARKQPTDYPEGFTHGIGYFMAAVMGQNNVGEFVHHPFLGWSFLINSQHRIWTERYGVGEAKVNKLIRSVGSR